MFQDVFARVFERLDSLRDPAAFRPWLGQLTRRCCVDALRSGSREEPSDQLEDAADEVLDSLDEALAVRQSLAMLSGDCQEILDRFFCRDESYKSIGDALSLPAGTIASRISRCLTRLRDEFEGRNTPVPRPVNRSHDDGLRRTANRGVACRTPRPAPRVGRGCAAVAATADRDRPPRCAGGGGLGIPGGADPGPRDGASARGCGAVATRHRAIAPAPRFVAAPQPRRLRR